MRRTAAPLPACYLPRNHIIRAEQGLWASTRTDRFRCWLPYGKWICADGREVLFNRFYEPIWERPPGGSARRADPEEWVPYQHQEWFFKDRSSPWCRGEGQQRATATLVRCLGVLKEFGASWEPVAHYAAVRRAAEQLP